MLLYLEPIRITRRREKRSNHKPNEEMPGSSPDFCREPHQQTTKAVHPRMAPFHHPPPRFESGLPFDGVGLFSSWANMSGKTEFAQDVAHLLVVVPFVQTHPLRLLLAWLRTLDHDAFDRRSHQFHIVAIGSLNREADGDAMPLGEQAAFHPTLAL